MRYNAVGWFELYVQDMARARRFYETVFGVTLQKLDAGDLQMYAFPGDSGVYGSPGALVHMPGVASGGSGTLVYFSCADCAIEAARAADAGGRVERDKMAIGSYGFIALVIDTEGNRIGLHTPPPGM